MSDPTNMFEQLISKYFPEYESYEEYPNLHELEFRVRGQEVEFDRLEAVSKILDTKLINFHSTTVQSGYCETCSYEENYVIIKCSGVRFSEDDPIPENPQIVQGDSIIRHD